MEENKKIKTILFLLNDNDRALLSVMKNKFEKEAGWKSIVTQSYLEAMTAYEIEGPDAIMTEIILNDQTGKSGFDLIAEIRSKEIEKKNIPIIVFSELEQDDDIRKAKELGATEYFIKTRVTMNELISEIQQIVVTTYKA